MESIFEEVEVSLMALEESVEAREAHEKQVEERFQLTMYQVTSFEHQNMEIIANNFNIFNFSILSIKSKIS